MSNWLESNVFNKNFKIESYLDRKVLDCGILLVEDVRVYPWLNASWLDLGMGGTSLLAPVKEKYKYDIVNELKSNELMSKEKKATSHR